jgi:hypothetical protein
MQRAGRNKFFSDFFRFFFLGRFYESPGCNLPEFFSKNGNEWRVKCSAASPPNNKNIQFQPRTIYHYLSF